MKPNPKKIPPKLFPSQKRELRIFLYNLWGECCPECGLWREMDQMHIAHSCRSRGAGGGDNHIMWKCFKCHDEEHRWNVKDVRGKAQKSADNIQPMWKTNLIGPYYVTSAKKKQTNIGRNNGTNITEWCIKWLIKHGKNGRDKRPDTLDATTAIPYRAGTQSTQHPTPCTTVFSLSISTEKDTQ